MPHAVPPVVPGEVVISKVSNGKPTIKPLAAFTKLAPVVSLYEPPNTGTPVPAFHPTTILFCSWMNAAPKHVDYYMRMYMRLFPQTRIILVSIKTNEFLFQTEARRRSDVQTAVSALQARDPASERLFIHSLSNGGGKRVYNIASAYKAATGKTLPVQGWILDSAPGIPKFRRDIYALTVPVRTWGWFSWLPYLAVVLSTVSVVYVVVNWLPKWVWGELIWKPTAGINDSRLMPLSCVKGYVYSKEDLAIAWQDVEHHAEDAEKKGYHVEKMLVHGAEHVQQFRGKQGEEGYWGFIEKVWALAVARKIEAQPEVV